MSSLLKSGLSLQNSLEICSEITANKHNKELCKSIFQKVNNGYSLSESLNDYKSIFSNLYISLVKIGETIGTLDDVFEKLSKYLKSKKQIHEKILQALIYPFVVLIAVVFVILVTVLFVYPRIESVFEVFTENSQEVALKINSLKSGLMIFCFIFLVLILSITLISILYKISSRFRLLFDSLVLKLPVLGNYIKTIETNDFSFAMKILCSSYIPFSESLLKAKDVVKNRSYRKALKDVHDRIVTGADIATAFENENIFPAYLITWINLAQNTGRIDDVFSQIYEYYNTESENISSRIVVTIEPALILLTGLFVFLLVINFVLPIFNLLGAL